MLAFRLEELYTITHPEGKMRVRLEVVRIYQECQSLRETARRLGVSRNTVRKWVRRFQALGDEGLKDQPRRPHRFPRRIPLRWRDKSSKIRQETGWGRRRIAQALSLPEGTAWHILRRHLGERKGARPRRKTFYPARWAWEEEEPFRLAQVDTKDILDKGTSGTKLWDHLRKHRLPRYPWTFLEGRTRFQLLAYSYELSVINGLCFISLVMSWLRAWGIEPPVDWQKDWGQEFGGDNPDRL